MSEKIFSLLTGVEEEIPQIELPNEVDDEAELSKRLFTEYKSAQNTWQQQVAEDKNFEDGIQWTREQEIELKIKGQAPIVVNVIKPAVEQAIALLTANKPRFAHRLLNVCNALLQVVRGSFWKGCEHLETSLQESA